jgi:uncharacterized protein
MDQQDHQAIEGLFAKLGEVERQSGPRDAEAEAFIRQRVTAQPAAPYLMAQTIVVQEQALNAAQARIAELEHQLASRPAGGGGFLSGLFGGGPPQPGPQPHQSLPQQGLSPHMAPGVSQMAPGRGGGGFLAGAAQTAMGVAGGVLLGNMIAGAFSGGDEAKAGEANQPEPQQAASEDFGDSGDDPGFDDV